MSQVTEQPVSSSDLNNRDSRRNALSLTTNYPPEDYYRVNSENQLYHREL